MKARWAKHTLKFRKAAQTSRGAYLEKPAYYLYLSEANNDFVAIGECGLLPGLSYDDKPGYEQQLDRLVNAINDKESLPPLHEWPSIALGLEMALLNLKHGEDGIIFPSAFTKGEDAIPINGLVWMDSAQNMQQQIEEKLREGFSCIKLKIGAIEFERELALLASIRERFGPGEIEIRVDANGAFKPGEAKEKLQKLAAFELHSIEQPIMAGQWEDMAALCAESPVPIALDEELIGLIDAEEREAAMEHIKPQAIVLKPSLLGAFSVSDEWIQLAEDYGARWWITSALESNVGLNAIAQYAYACGGSEQQGLGTGRLYTNNVEGPLEIRDGHLHHLPKRNWDYSVLP